MLPRFVFGQKVYIRKGFYRGFKAEVKSFSIAKFQNTKTGDDEEAIFYKVRVENAPIKDFNEGLLDVPEEWLLSYKKWGLF